MVERKNLFVATNSHKIANVVKKEKYKVVMTNSV